MIDYSETIIAKIHREEIERAVRHNREVEKARQGRRHSPEQMQHKWQQGVMRFLNRGKRPHANN